MTNLTTKQTDKTVSACKEGHKKDCDMLSNVGIPKAQKDESYCTCGKLPTNPPTETTRYNGGPHAGELVKPTVEKWEKELSDIPVTIITPYGDMYKTISISKIVEYNHLLSLIRTTIAQSVQEAKAEERKEVIERVGMGLHRWSQMVWKENHLRKSNWVDAEEIEASLRSYCAPYREENSHASLKQEEEK